MKDYKFLKEVGNKVKSARMEKGITIRELGSLCKMDYSNLSRFENGQKNIRIQTLRDIANVLEVDMKDFL